MSKHAELERLVQKAHSAGCCRRFHVVFGSKAKRCEEAEAVLESKT
jgi:hypothetical protein